jgi:hypothetical protein
MNNYSEIVTGFMIEFITYFLAASIGYAVLALQWEGYYGHRLL